MLALPAGLYGEPAPHERPVLQPLKGGASAPVDVNPAVFSGNALSASIYRRTFCSLLQIRAYPYVAMRPLSSARPDGRLQTAWDRA